MELSKREFIALELLKEMVKVNIDDTVNMAYLLADEFIDMSDKDSGYEPATADQVDANNNEIFSYSIELFELSLRTYNALQSESITTLGELVSKTERDLLRIPQLGKKALAELKHVLAMNGLTLDMSDKDKADYIVKDTYYFMIRAKEYPYMR